MTASLVLRKLASYPRQNGLAWGLREIGRIDRTLFTLDWLQSPDLRRRVTVGLNKGEAKNTLVVARCVSTAAVWSRIAPSTTSGSAPAG